MNNICPACGALYNVAEKDIGRRLKCKKCSAALTIVEEGLVLDGASGASPIVSEGRSPRSSRADDYADDDEDSEAPRRKRDRAPLGPGFNPLAPLAAIGGVSSLLFGFGVLLVIFFTSLPLIGQAGSDRAEAYVAKLEIERDLRIKDKEPKKKQAEWTPEDVRAYAEAEGKIRDDYKKLLEEARLDAERTRIANRRDVWLERYGLMFGFIFVAFGCIGYLRTEQPLVLKIVAAVIVAFMMMVMFTGFEGAKSPGPVPIPKGGGGKTAGPLEK